MKYHAEIDAGGRNGGNADQAGGRDGPNVADWRLGDQEEVSKFTVRYRLRTLRLTAS